MAFLEEFFQVSAEFCGIWYPLVITFIFQFKSKFAKLSESRQILNQATEFSHFMQNLASAGDYFYFPIKIQVCDAF